MIKKTYHLTTAGKQELEKELEQLIARRKGVAERIATARAQGDLAENADYDAAREEQAIAETRIAEIEEILQNADLITDDGDDSVVQLGNKVSLDDSKKTVEYTIVGPVEADPLGGKISNESPLGRAVLGKKVGDRVSVETPKGEVNYEVKKID